MGVILKKIAIVLGFVFIIAGLFILYCEMTDRGSGTGLVHVEFIATQKDADATLICQEGFAILIDTGEEDDAEAILAKMQEYNVEKLNYLIFSHGDKDHIGSARKIMSAVQVKKVIAPYYTGSDDMKELLQDIKDAGIPILYPAHNMHISAGEIDINCYPSLEKHYSDENNYSLAVLIKHHDVNMLFTGDALRIRSEELERIHWKDITLYKVPHHGRSNSQSINLFEDLNPQIAVVTSDECDRDITKAAQNCNSTLLFTRPDGLSFVSDGKTLTYISE